MHPLPSRAFPRCECPGCATVRFSSLRQSGVEASDDAASSSVRDSCDQQDTLVVLEYDMPTAEQVAHLGQGWNLHPLVVEDLLKAGQRPKLERYGDVLFMVARLASYDDPTEDVQVEFHLLLRASIVVILYQARDREAVRYVHRLARDPAPCSAWAQSRSSTPSSTPPSDGYVQVVADLEADREAIERQVSSTAMTRSPSASIDSRARSSTCSTRPFPSWTLSKPCRRGPTTTRSTRVCMRTCRTFSTSLDAGHWCDRRASGGARIDPRVNATPGPASGEQGSSEDLVGPPSCSRRLSSARSA